MIKGKGLVMEFLHFTSISISKINKYSSMDQNSGESDGRISSGPFSAKFPKSFSKLRSSFQNSSIANQGMTSLSLSLSSWVQNQI